MSVPQTLIIILVTLITADYVSASQDLEQLSKSQAEPGTMRDDPASAHQGAAQSTPQPASSPALAPDRAHTRPFPTPSNPAPPRWLDEVRAQRQAVQVQRRAAHQARREALDPIGTAQREQRKEQMLRRREELRDSLEQTRRRYLNHGPWLAPLPPQFTVPERVDDSRGESTAERSETQSAGSNNPPPEWNNLWYYQGW